MVGHRFEAPAALRSIRKLYDEDAPMLVWALAQATDAYSDKVEGYETWDGRRSRF